MNPLSIFKNLKIVELASVLAGPAVGMFFAELGASVLKIENKTTGGDVTRKWKLPKEDVSSPFSAYYHSVNWGKKSLLMDLRDELDKARVLELIADADIVIANFKSGSPQKLGLAYEQLKTLNPSLIYANLTAYGEGDDTPGFDVLLQAETGFLYMNGETEGPPVKMPVALIDILAAHQLKEGILIALLQRQQTGRGSYVTASLAKSAIAALANQASNWLNVGHIPQRMGTQHPNITPYGDTFTTKDGKQIILAVGTDKQFAQLCDILNLPILKKDPQFVTNAARVQHRQTLVARLRPAFLQYTQKELLTQCKAQKVPAGVIRNMQEVFELPVAQAMILENEDGSKCVRTVAFDIL